MQLIMLVLLLFSTSIVHAAPDGSQLFATYCAVCHGDKGNGGVGIPLALPSFLESVDNDFLRKTIRYGRPGRVMPAFPALSDAQLNAIVGVIRGWSGKPEPEFSYEPVKGNPVHGRELYVSYCAKCHGADGEGGKGTGVTFSRRRDLPIIAPALKNPGFLAAASDEMIRHTLMYGREGTPMRSFSCRDYPRRTSMIWSAMSDPSATSRLPVIERCQWMHRYLLRNHLIRSRKRLRTSVNPSSVRISS